MTGILAIPIWEWLIKRPQTPSPMIAVRRIIPSPDLIMITYHVLRVMTYPINLNKKSVGRKSTSILYKNLRSREIWAYQIHEPTDLGHALGVVDEIFGLLHYHGYL